MSKPFVLTPSQRMTSAQVMAKFAIEDGNQNLFHLGCCSERATIFSQQQRALNLAWAFDDSGFLNNKKVAVLGAGFAGITFTAALKVLGHAHSLFLYDRAGHLRWPQ